MRRQGLLKKLVLIFCVFSSGSIYAGDDWGDFARYSASNEVLKKDGIKPVAVFMGNSITEGWVKDDPGFFSKNNYEGRGISGQTTYQMLLRFRDDVINLSPEVVVINGGTNDIAENNHEYNEDRTFGNIVSMVELAEANGIKVILTSVLPASEFPWRKTIQKAPLKIKSLNERIKEYAAEHGIEYVDYFSSMTDDGDSLSSKYTLDGVHPTHPGYEVMEALIVPAVNRVKR